MSQHDKRFKFIICRCLLKLSFLQLKISDNNVCSKMKLALQVISVGGGVLE